MFAWLSSNDQSVADQNREPTVATIELSDNQVAIVDDADLERCLERCAGHRWYPRPASSGPLCYVGTYIQLPNGRRKDILLHRYIMNAPDGIRVDHKDGDGLNNRRNNLRFATGSQNGGNSTKRRVATSPFKGVSWHKQKRKWQAQIRKHGVITHLGLFAREVDAALTYDRAAVVVYGEFARLNFTPCEPALASTHEATCAAGVFSQPVSL